MIDTHTHLYSSQFDEDRGRAIARAKENGVEQVFLPSIDKAYFPSMEKMEKADPEWVKLMIGLHPCSVTASNRIEMEFVKNQLKSRAFSAIGEIGIDLYWDKTHLDEQKSVFRQHCNWALEYKLPIIIHVREAFDEVFELLEEYRNTNLTGIFHCFTGGKKELDQVLDLGFKAGIGGVLTFKNGGLDKTLAQYNSREIISHLVLETDAPYLAPHPHRGKRNETAYISLVAQKLSEVLDLPLDEIKNKTTQNALEIFVSY